MSDTIVPTDEALDAVASLCDAAVDYSKLVGQVRRASRSKAFASQGKRVDTAKAVEILTSLLVELINDAAVIAQGDDDDRLDLCKRVADSAVRKAVGE